MKKRISLATVGILLSMTAHAESVTVEHSMGKTTLEQNPQRVVVIGLGVLDAVDTFGIEPIAISKVPQIPNYLEKYKAEKYGAAGSLFEPDFEKIYTLKPDLILIGPRAAKSYGELTKIAPTIVFAVDANKGYWQSTQEQWKNLGKVFNIENKVDEKIDQLDKKFQAVRAYNQNHNLDAMTVMTNGGNITAFGADSRFSSIYQDFGFKETVPTKKNSSHGDLVSYEFIRENDPKVLLVIDRNKLTNPNDDQGSKEFYNDLIKATQAYKNNSIAFLDLNAWYLSIAGVKATEKMISDMEKSVGL